MENMVLTLHIIVCVILIILVLLQSGKEGMGVIFGGGSSSLFGSTGAGGILVKLTTFVAAVFLVTSLGYNILTSAVKSTKESTIIDLSIDDPSVPAPPVAPQTPASSVPAPSVAPQTPASPGASPAPEANPGSPSTQ